MSKRGRRARQSPAEVVTILSPDTAEGLRKVYDRYDADVKEWGEGVAQFNAGHEAGWDNGVATARAQVMPLIDLLAAAKPASWSMRERKLYDRVVAWLDAKAKLHEKRLAAIDAQDKRDASREMKRARDRRYRKRMARSAR